ncbi:hypothetical protein BD309DRAFT_972413, partial [Dichomitus squalens]
MVRGFLLYLSAFLHVHVHLGALQSRCGTNGGSSRRTQARLSGCTSAEFDIMPTLPPATPVHATR